MSFHCVGARLLWLLLGLAAVPVGGRAATTEAARFDERNYATLFSVGRQCGLSSQWDASRKVFQLVGPNVRVEFEADSRELRLNGLRLFLCDGAVLHRKTLYLSRIDRDRFLLPIFNPRRIEGPPPALHTIVLDAGHGGKDEGTRAPVNGLLEKNVALDVVRRLAALLEAAGYRVVLTRNTDTFVPLPDRPLLANREKADLFVAIHLNAIDNPAVNGTETYILTPQHQHSTGSDRASEDDAILLPGNRTDEWNAVLGYRMHRAVLLGLKSYDRGLKRARWAVLRDLNCPGLLIEGGYLSNETEARRIATPEWRDQFAQAVVAGIASYREALDLARKK